MVITKNRLVNFGIDRALSGKIIEKIIWLGVASKNTKEMVTQMRHGRLMELTMYQRGLPLESSINALEEYIKADMKHTKVEMWKDVIVLLKNIEKSYSEKAS